MYQLYIKMMMMMMMMIIIIIITTIIIMSLQYFFESRVFGWDAHSRGQLFKGGPLLEVRNLIRALI